MLPGEFTMKYGELTHNVPSNTQSKGRYARISTWNRTKPSKPRADFNAHTSILLKNFELYKLQQVITALIEIFNLLEGTKCKKCSRETKELAQKTGH